MAIVACDVPVADRRRRARLHAAAALDRNNAVAKGGHDFY
jgi:hypothetical protein